MSDLSPLEGKTVLVIGGGAGMGTDEALFASAEGADVIIAGPSRERCEEVISEISGEGGDASWIPLDVHQESSWQALRAEIEREYGSLDLAVNEEGLIFAHSLAECTAKNWQNSRGAGGRELISIKQWTDEKSAS